MPLITRKPELISCRRSVGWRGVNRGSSRGCVAPFDNLQRVDVVKHRRAATRSRELQRDRAFQFERPQRLGEAAASRVRTTDG